MRDTPPSPPNTFSPKEVQLKATDRLSNSNSTYSLASDFQPKHLLQLLPLLSGSCNKINSPPTKKKKKETVNSTINIYVLTAQANFVTAVVDFTELE